MTTQKNNPTCIDLFSGAGGISKGFEMAGFQVSLGLDIDRPSLLSFERNHLGALAINQDMSQFPATSLKEFLPTKPDVIIGGPPCQGFSLSGPRVAEDPRNRLVFFYLDAIREFMPSAFLIENVPGLAALYGGKTKDELVRSLEDLGYGVSDSVLNAADYGIPQNRKRFILVGMKSGNKFKFPESTHGHSKIPSVTVGDALSDLPILEDEEGFDGMPYYCEPKSQYQKLCRQNSSEIFNHIATNHTNRTREIIALVPEGKNYKSLPENLRNTRNFHVAWTRIDSRKPSPTIDTGHRHHFHYKANRVPTVRECARIQSFPDDFIFYGTKTSQYRQVGNAVPPLLAKVIAESLREQM